LVLALGLDLSLKTPGPSQYFCKNSIGGGRNWISVSLEY